MTTPIPAIPTPTSIPLEKGVPSDPSLTDDADAFFELMIEEEAPSIEAETQDAEDPNDAPDSDVEPDLANVAEVIDFDSEKSNEVSISGQVAPLVPETIINAATRLNQPSKEFVPGAAVLGDSPPKLTQEPHAGPVSQRSEVKAERTVIASPQIPANRPQQPAHALLPTEPQVVPTSMIQPLETVEFVPRRQETQRAGLSSPVPTVGPSNAMPKPEQAIVPLQPPQEDAVPLAKVEEQFESPKPRVDVATHQPAPAQNAPPPIGIAEFITTRRPMPVAVETDAIQLVPTEIDELTAPRTTVQGTTTNAIPTVPVVPRQVAQQVAMAVVSQNGGTTEVALNPAELGRVRLTLSAQDTAIVLMVQAERPETGDMMRRHIDVLAQEFRSLGYGSIKFEFSGTGTQADTHNAQPDADTHDGAADDSVHGLDDAPPPTAGPANGGGLDLRI